MSKRRYFYSLVFILGLVKFIFYVTTSTDFKEIKTLNDPDYYISDFLSNEERILCENPEKDENKQIKGKNINSFSVGKISCIHITLKTFRKTVISIFYRVDLIDLPPPLCV